MALAFLHPPLGRGMAKLGDMVRRFHFQQKFSNSVHRPKPGEPGQDMHITRAHPKVTL